MRTVVRQNPRLAVRHDEIDESQIDIDMLIDHGHFTHLPHNPGTRYGQKRAYNLAVGDTTTITGGATSTSL